MKKAITILLAVILLLSSCTPTETAPKQERPQESGSEPETQVKKDTINIAIPSDFATMDPVSIASAVDFEILSNVYDSLVEVRSGNEIVPMLAESYEISEDGKTYVFTVRDGVKFHNGATLEPSDVIFSLERSMESPYQALFTQYIDHFELTEDQKVSITLKAPTAPFLMQLSFFFAVTDQETVEKAGEEFKNNPIGTGPYQFVERKPGESLTLKAFDDYFKVQR